MRVDVETLLAQGYAITSRAYGIASRLDRPDWRERMAKEHAPWDWQGEGMSWVHALGDSGAANHYRRVYSTDKIEDRSLVGQLPNSSGGPREYRPKNQETDNEPHQEHTMDKNIAAFLRPNARTIYVEFTKNGDKYTYVTDLPLEAGDVVAVPVQNASTAPLGINVAHVVEVHDDLLIEPNDKMKYKWVIGKIDLTYYHELETKNKELTDVLATSYRQNLRASFAQTVMAGLPDAARESIANILNPSVSLPSPKPLPKGRATVHKHILAISETAWTLINVEQLPWCVIGLGTCSPGGWVEVPSDTLVVRDDPASPSTHRAGYFVFSSGLADPLPAASKDKRYFTFSSDRRPHTKELQMTNPLRPFDLNAALQGEKVLLHHAAILPAWCTTTPTPPAATKP